MIQISVIQGLDEYHLHTRLPRTQKKLRYHLAGHLLCTDNGQDIWVYSITRRFLFTVKETVKDYVLVDSESVTHNM